MKSLTPSLRPAKRQLKTALDTTNEAVKQHPRLLRRASFLATLHSVAVTVRFRTWQASEFFRRFGF